MISAGNAREIARQWVEEQASRIPGFHGAFLVGSINWRADDDPLPPGSDVDVRIVVDLDRAQMDAQGLRQRILSRGGVLLDTGYDPVSQFRTPEQVLASYHRACHFSVPNVLSDPSGQLSALQQAVQAQYGQIKWVNARIARAEEAVRANLDDLASTDVANCLMPLGSAVMGIAQIPALANLGNPTMRKCLGVYHELVAGQGRDDLYESLLALLGSDAMRREDVVGHQRQLVQTYDRALEIVRSPSLGDFVSPAARPMTIGGAQALIEGGAHREAIFWIAVTHFVCRPTYHGDGSEEDRVWYEERYTAFLDALGLRSTDDLHARAQHGRRLLADVLRVAEEMVVANPAILA